MKLESVIGLEIHIQLKTVSKMFCACPTHQSAAAPNKNICPVCMAHPGALPVPNEQAVSWAVLAGLALNGTIATDSKFDRKNYFYPDLPKGYQISQFDLPIMEEGYLDIEVSGGERETIRIGITRLHLEEDAAKNIHDAKSGKTYVDYNRGGTPLVEIVTEPDLRSPAEAKALLQELRLIARYLGISDADMEKGHLRCDANISLRKVGENKLHEKTEIKNLNSFKMVERALEYEIIRQSKLWEEGKIPKVPTTRGWDDSKQVTVEQRTKEDSADYRYFPDPDLPMMNLSELTQAAEKHLPEMPRERRLRFVSEYLLSNTDAKQICDNPALADYTENVFSELDAWLKSQPDLTDGADEMIAKHQKKLAKLVAGWLLSKLGGIMKAQAIDIKVLKITPENFAEFITLLATGKLSSKNGMIVLEEMVASGADPSHIMEDKKLGKLEDEDTIAEAAERVIKNHPAEVARYKAGKTELMQFFIGMLMKETEGNADPGLTKNVLAVKLEETSD